MLESQTNINESIYTFIPPLYLLAYLEPLLDFAMVLLYFSICKQLDGGQTDEYVGHSGLLICKP
jgi:hypothetical protein